MPVRGRGLLSTGALVLDWVFAKGSGPLANGDIMCPFMYRLRGWVALAGLAADRSPS